MKEIISWLFKDPTVAWLDLTMPNQAVKNGVQAKKIKLPQMDFFSRKTTNKIFMHLLAPFILQNFKKIPRTNPELRMCHFWAQNSPFVMSKTFLVQTIITFIYLLAPFIVQIQSYEDAQILGQKWPISPNANFFQKACC